MNQVSLGWDMLRIRTKEHITQAEKKIAEERQKNKTPQIKKVEDAIRLEGAGVRAHGIKEGFLSGIREQRVGKIRAQGIAKVSAHQ